MSDVITLSKADLDQMVKDAVTQAVASITTPVEATPEKSPRAQRAYDVTDSEKVAKSKLGKATGKYWGKAGAQAPATFGMRKRISAFADLKNGGTAVSDRIFSGPLTRAQATTASAVLESGRSVRIDDLEIDPR